MRGPGAQGFESVFVAAERVLIRSQSLFEVSGIAGQQSVCNRIRLQDCERGRFFHCTIRQDFARNQHIVSRINRSAWKIQSRSGKSDCHKSAQIGP